MNNLQIFNNPEFGEIRTIQKDGEPWFVGKDVAVALGYKDTVNALKSKVDDEDKGGWRITTPSGIQEMTIINESGLYCLIFSSKLEKAKRFKHWVTAEVLPTIRRTGSYTLNRYPPAVSPNGLSRLIGKYEKRMEQMNCSPAEILSMMQHFCVVWSITPPEVVTRHIPEQLCFWDMPGLQGGGPLLID